VQLSLVRKIVPKPIFFVELSSGAKQIGLLLLGMSLPLLLTDAALFRIQPSCAFEMTGPFEVYCGRAGSLALVAPLKQPVPGLITSGGCSASSPNRSAVTVLLNGRLTGPPRAQHEHIEQRGGGSYSHWGDYLIFSLPASVANSSDVVLSGEFIPRVHENVLGIAVALAVVGSLSLIIGKLLQRLTPSSRRRPV